MHFITPTKKCEKVYIYIYIYSLKIYQNIKYIGINLTKEIKDSKPENYNTLIRKTDDRWNEKILHALQLKELIIVKMIHYTK